MAFVHGKEAGVAFDGAILSAYLNAFESASEVDTAETTTFTNAWKTFLAGTIGQTVDLSGFFDPTQNYAWATIGDAPGPVLTLGPGGLAVGARVTMLRQLTASYGESADIGDAVAFSWGVTTDQTVGFGNVIAALTAVTTDGNVASFDGGAQTTNGAIAHLHVTSVSASDSIVVTIEDSANDSAFSNIGTFASKSAAGAERLVIPGTIRRYVRAVDDVTGAAVSIERLVAFARL